jgi:hypothetical protein
MNRKKYFATQHNKFDTPDIMSCQERLEAKPHTNDVFFEFLLILYSFFSIFAAAVTLG